MNNENGLQLSRPKTLRRLNLESVLDLQHTNFQSSDSATMSPMTNLVRNMSGTSLDSTPKRKFAVSLDRFDGEDQPISGLVGSGATSAASSSIIGDIRDDKTLSSDKENSYATGGSYLASLSPDKSLTKLAGTEGGFLNSPKVRRPALSTLDVNSPIKAGFIKPAPPSTLCGISAVRLPSIEDADSQDSGCYPEDSKFFKYPEPMSSHRRSMSDRNSVCSTSSARSCSSNTSGGSQRFSGGAAKLDFSFSSSGEDEGIPMDELFDDDAIQPIPTSSAVSRLFATPLSEKANQQFSTHDDSFDRMSDSPAGLIIRMPDLSKLTDSTENSCRPQLRRAWSMYENTTPNSRQSPAITGCSSPLDASPSRGLFPVYDEDPGSSPVAPLGLHVARIRMKPHDQRVIQPVGGPASKRSEPSSSYDSSFQAQENKRRKDDNDERSMSTQSENNVTTTCNKLMLCRGQNRIQRCHSETEATIMRALQRSTEEPDLIGDFTRPFLLPLTRGKHQDLKSISPQTLVELLDGRFKHLIENFVVVDCRYPYEYDHGHVRDAVNLWTKDMVWNRFMEGRKAISPSANGDAGHGPEKKRSIIIFHCEFSSERGPALSRYLRNKDRDDNKDNYPALHWPEVYLLEGGYKAFYENFQDWCDPHGYRPMNHPGHEEELRRCRAKTKSCQGEGKHGRPLTKSTSRRLALN